MVSIRFTRTGRHVAGLLLAPGSARLRRGPAARSKTGAKSGQESRSTRRSAALTMTTMDLSNPATPLRSRNCVERLARQPLQDGEKGHSGGGREHEEEGFLDERSQEHA